MNPAMQYPPPITAADMQIIERVEAIAKDKSWTMSQVALVWITKKVCSPIVGFSSVERMDEALGARGKELDEAETRSLEEQYLDRAVSGHR